MKIERNQKYFTIARYATLTIVISALAILAIFNFDSLAERLSAWAPGTGAVGKAVGADARPRIRAHAYNAVYSVGADPYGHACAAAAYKQHHRAV